jgi:type VI secretion system protein ImpH
MAAADRRENPGLSGRLFREPYRFDFFQAVRLLERLAGRRAETEPGTPHQPVGRDRPADQEVVRFRALPALSFPAGTVSQIALPAAGPHAADNGRPARPEMVVAFLGLTGPQGVLPQHYTSMLLQRVRLKDFALRDFLDLFNHRLISLFYRAWEKYRLPFAYERSRLDPVGRDEDLATRGLYALVGLGTAGLRGRLDIDDQAFLFYAGHFAHQPRSAVALEGILEDYFEMPTRVRQLQGQWLYLQADEQAALPDAARPEGLHNRLGVGVVVGNRVWDVQGKFRVRLGPLGYAQFLRLMPNGDGLRPLCQLTRVYVGGELDFDVQTVLKPKEVPWCRLRTQGADRPHLGWNTWARSRQFKREVDDAVFTLPGV